MKTKRSFFLLYFSGLILICICSGCAEKTPEFIQHEPPVLPTPDISQFSADGCTVAGDGALKCPEGSQPAELNCTYLLKPDPVLGALHPAYPLAKCALGYDKNPPESGDDFIYEEGCLDHRWVQFVIYRDGQFQYLKRVADMQAAYAPIESPEEALSYAAAATGLKPRYDLAPAPEYRYEDSQVEETHVDIIDDTFSINLFAYQSCGCGPHPLTMVVVSVNKDGQVFSSSPIDLFRDPKLDKVCGD